MLSKLVFLFPYLKIILIHRKKIISSFNFFQQPILTSLSSAENKIMEFKNIVLYSLSSILFDEINGHELYFNTVVVYLITFRIGHERTMLCWYALDVTTLMKCM